MKSSAQITQRKLDILLVVIGLILQKVFKRYTYFYFRLLFRRQSLAHINHKPGCHIMYLIIPM